MIPSNDERACPCQLTLFLSLQEQGDEQRLEPGQRPADWAGARTDFYFSDKSASDGTPNTYDGYSQDKVLYMLVKATAHKKILYPKVKD